MYVLSGQKPIVYCPHNLILVSFAIRHLKNRDYVGEHEYALGPTHNAIRKHQQKL